MINVVAWNIVRFVFLLLIQALIINTVDFGSWLNPMLYVLALILLPIRITRWAELSIAFVFGFAMDMFTRTPGLNTTAALMLAFVRPTIIRWVAPREGFETATQPDLYVMGFSRFLTYVSVLVVIHHVWYFSVEVMSTANIFHTIIRIVASSVVSIVLIFLSQYLFMRPFKAR